jgi:hypothetical protein
MSQTRETRNRWDVLVDALLDERAALTTQIRERFQAEMGRLPLDPGRGTRSRHRA